ncbi:MAG: cobalamin-binding protein [Firmicutes bacterium]|nr:cobalamin-binding protein [Bacillota bacterium]
MSVSTLLNHPGSSPAGARNRRSAVRLLAGVTALAILLLAGLTGCSLLGPKEVAIEDLAGRQVKVAAKPQRIVSLVPSNTEILFALGLGNRVVGVSNFDNYPPEVAQIEKVGDAFKADYEKLVSLKPDLVLSARGSIVDELTKLGITVVVVDAPDLSAVAGSIRFLGKVTGAAREAEKVAAEFEGKIQAVASVTEKIGDADRPLVYFEVSQNPLWTIGPGSFMFDLVKMAGGKNLFPDARQPYLEVGDEEVVSRNPGFVLLTFPYMKDVLARPAWAAVSAVKTGKVYEVDGDIFSRPTPRLAQALEELVEMLHPGLLKR